MAFRVRVSRDDFPYGDSMIRSFDPDYGRLLFLPRIPDGPEISESGTGYTLDVLLYTGGSETPDIVFGSAQNNQLRLELDCRCITGTGEMVSKPVLINEISESKYEMFIQLNRAEIYETIKEYISAWENGDANMLLENTWTQWLAWHPDALNEITAMCIEFKPPLFDSSARWQELSCIKYTFPGGTEYLEYTARLALKSFDPSGGYFAPTLYKESGRWHIDPQQLFISGETSTEIRDYIAHRVDYALAVFFAGWQSAQLSADWGYTVPWESVSGGAVEEAKAAFDEIDGTFSAYTAGAYALPAPGTPAIVPVTAYFADENGLLFTREMEMTLSLDMNERTCVIEGLRVR